jgi:hypothetical protein
LKQSDTSSPSFTYENAGLGLFIGKLKLMFDHTVLMPRMRQDLW